MKSRHDTPQMGFLQREIYKTFYIPCYNPNLRSIEYIISIDPKDFTALLTQINIRIKS